MPLFQATRQFTQREVVKVVANSESEARQLIEDDDPSCEILEEIDGDYEISGHVEKIANE